MIPRLFILLALCAVGSLTAADRKTESSKSRKATAASGASGPSFDTFRTIGERNIFDANRRGRSRSSEEPTPRPDTISFVGTMDYEKGVLAFFDGSDPTYRKALRVGQSLGQFKITKIEATGVELEREGKAISMRLMQQLRKPVDGEWSLIGADVVRSEAAARAAESARPDPTAPPVIPANVDDVTRRMMERRQKELKQ